MTNDSVVSDISNKLFIIIPFYKNPHLVKRIFDSLISIQSELIALNASVYLYNDSPDCQELSDAIAKCTFNNGTIKLIKPINDKNLGFIKTVNKGFKETRAQKADVIILNSDTIVYPGAFTEMQSVAALDAMTGFVCPRSNNATIANIPHTPDHKLSPDDCYAAFLKISPNLNRITFVPTGIGFCLYIKHTILAEFGFFDEIYGQGYNEENDLIMRANRCGYRSVLANHAFVWHEGEQSFAKTKHSKNSVEHKNATILHARFNEYPQLIHHYLNSPEYRAEELLCLLNDSNGKTRIAFDCSHISNIHNGTSETAINLLKAAVNTWPHEYEIFVYMDKTAFTFHQLDKIKKLNRFEIHDPNAKVMAMVRTGQPFHPHDLQHMFTRAPIVCIFMLDVISFDCGYLATQFNHKVWYFVFKYTDIIFTISKYTLNLIQNRFKIGSRVITRISRLSLDVHEYVGKRKLQNKPSQNHLFIVGNHFQHKFVIQTTDALAQALPKEKIIALGYEQTPTHKNIKACTSGRLSDDELEHFYINAKAIIFPSHYEGFGLPLLHSLARKKIIYIREMDLYKELSEHIEGAENIILYQTTEELVQLLKNGTPDWTEAKPKKAPTWEDSSLEILESIKQAQQNISYDFLVERLRWMDYAMSHNQENVPVSPQRQIANKVEHILNKLLTYPTIKKIAAYNWRAYKYLKSKV